MSSAAVIDQTDFPSPAQTKAQLVCVFGGPNGFLCWAAPCAPDRWFCEVVVKHQKQQAVLHGRAGQFLY